MGNHMQTTEKKEHVLVIYKLLDKITHKTIHAKR